MAMYAKIRRMYFREHLTISEIQRRTSLSRNTIKKWFKETGEPRYQRPKRDSKLTPFKPKIKLALETDAHRPRRDRRTALMIFRSIQRDGYTGCYAQVTEFIRACRQDVAMGSKSAYVPLKFELGEAFQFDWSEESLVIGGICRKIQAAHTKLCASRAFMLCAYPSQRHEMLFDAHTRAFTALGGIPKRGIYDNMKTAVDKVRRGEERIVNTRFYAMVSHYLFDADFCNVAAGWEKGVVEKNVQDARRRVWQEAKMRRFGSFTELNAWLEVKCRALWTELKHPDYDNITVADALEQEQMYLMPMPAPFDGYVEVLARVSSTCLITVLRNRYSVPCHLANHKVAVHLYPAHIEVYADNACVASHVRLLDRDQVSYDWQHYIPLIERKPGALRYGAPFADMPTALLRLQGELRRRDRHEAGRVMAKVLAAIPAHGLEAVLVAAELVLESGVPSIEHVLNVLARLNQQPMPERVETHLTLSEEPLADTTRYDSLNVEEAPHG